MTLTEDSGEFVCLECGESFATSDELDDHISTEHPEYDDDDEEYEDDDEFDDEDFDDAEQVDV